MPRIQTPTYMFSRTVLSSLLKAHKSGGGWEQSVRTQFGRSLVNSSGWAGVGRSGSQQVGQAGQVGAGRGPKLGSDPSLDFERSAGHGCNLQEVNRNGENPDSKAQ